MNWKDLIKKFTPIFLLSFYHYLLAAIGAFLYGFPSRPRRGSPDEAAKKLTVIGITGTSGKSTVVELTAKILEGALRQAQDKHKVASLSSIKFKIGEKEWENRLKMTMPGRMKIQRFLRQAVKADCKYVVLEVTSEGIKQYRHKFIDFDIAVLTNLSPEHIEAHGGFEKYEEAKAELFKATKKIHIINLDDEHSEYFWKIPAEKKIGYGIKDSGVLPKGLKLLGKFNLYNAIAAIKIGMALEVSLEICKTALEKVKGIPGRMEIVIKEPFTVVVDYAHTPEALKKVYQTIRHYKSDKSRMICVLGACGGGRDKWKRPVLGKIAARYCDEIIITNEDPYDEDPSQILSMVKSGISNSPGREADSLEGCFPISLDPKGTPRRVAFYEILDRKKAIRKALKIANPGDVVIITGKGSEPWMCVAEGKKIPWDDRKVAREEFQKIQK